MTELVRQEVIATAQRVVVKVGSRVLTTGEGVLDTERVESLAENICDLVEGGREVILVSSGAVAAGMGHLGIERRPSDVAGLQAIAALGQTRLMNRYDEYFSRRGRHAAQVLLTAEDLNDRGRYLNVRNTLLKLLDFGVVPVINENDAVSIDELVTTFGDNDRLAALVTNSLRASLLVVLSDIDGLYDGNPAKQDSQLIPFVSSITDQVMSLACDTTSNLSRGGMASKLNAARIVTAAGENVIIASGRQPNVLKRLFEGEPLGTLFIAQGKSVSPLKRWIGFSAQSQGTLVIDEGAKAAISKDGRSLLAIGITDIEGDFEKGDVITITGVGRTELARGLCNYSSTDVRKIRGMKTSSIAGVLGHVPFEAVVHRDNLMMLDSDDA